MSWNEVKPGLFTIQSEWQFFKWELPSLAIAELSFRMNHAVCQQVGSTGDHRAENHLKCGSSVNTREADSMPGLGLIAWDPQRSTSHCCPLGAANLWRKQRTDWPLSHTVVAAMTAAAMAHASAPLHPDLPKRPHQSRTVSEAHWPGCYIRIIRYFRATVLRPLPRTEELEFLGM